MHALVAGCPRAPIVSKENIDEAIGLFKRTVALDPEYSSAPRKWRTCIYKAMEAANEVDDAIAAVGNVTVHARDYYEIGERAATDASTEHHCASPPRSALSST